MGLGRCWFIADLSPVVNLRIGMMMTRPHFQTQAPEWKGS